MKGTIRLYKYGKKATVCSLTTAILLWIGAAVFMAFGFKGRAYFVVGMIICLPASILLVYLLLSPFFVEIDSHTVSERNAFGKLKKEHSFENLREIKIVNSYYRSWCERYLCLIFSEGDFSTHNSQDLLREEGVIMFEYSKKNAELLKNYTQIPILAPTTGAQF